ncbi:hypothetical protein Q4508_12450 [Amphritea sp. 2_MG-2023]|uniref:hypothetical protein n=1 Tax=Amphritea TaxID=515417 RepID=UPI001C06B507|nr:MULTISPECIES: hypothetical protein [Amphritea]MBU2967085.1 hypothetical protein [Amphritea atlantica]MDO6419362.1 hypothetical protein [Amphritea sp. 2_MG-2023]
MNNVSAWGDNPPEFIRVLAQLVRETGSKKAAAACIGIDRASVSTLLANKYPANIRRMEQKIMAYRTAVECPILGTIDSGECQKQRQMPFISSNPQRIALYRACRSCPRNPESQENSHD